MKPFRKLIGNMDGTVVPLGVRHFQMKKLTAIAAILVLLLIYQPMRALGREMTDPLGRKIVVPDSPRRVVALAPNLTEIVFALGEEKRLIGVSLHSDYPPAAKSIETVGSYVYLDTERIVALKPDVCIAIKDGNPKEVIERLEAFHIPVFAVDPRTLEAVLSAIVQIGDLLQAGDRARNLVHSLQERITKVARAVKQGAKRPRVFFQIGSAPIVSAGTNTFIHELIEGAGGENLADGPVPYPRFSREQVLALAPDIIIITSMEHSTDFDSAKAEWATWPELPAARNRRIFTEDANLFDRATPRLVDGLEHLARLIHPELFGESK
jgi:iron complex transport system substrate-binding protein